MLEFRELTDSAEDLALLGRFYEDLYTSEFPDPDERESLANMQKYLRRKRSGWYGRNNYHILLLLQNGEPIAGSISDYLAEPNAGVIEFLVVGPQARRSGLGQKLLDWTEGTLQQDAATVHGASLTCVVAEMNDPFRATDIPDSLDPFLRVSIWDRWGFGKLDFPYAQPALSPDQQPVDYLLLIAKPMQPPLRNALPARLVKEILSGYLIWAMRIDEPANDPTYREMLAYLDRRELIPLQSLAAYVGDDPERPMVIRPITSVADPDYAAAMQLYRRCFPVGPLSIHETAFGNLLSHSTDGDAGTGRSFDYHLWAIRLTDDAPLAGLASFFTLPGVGFGGYLALDAPLRGTGRCRSLVARIERQMVHDRRGARGWYIECDPDDAALAVFVRLGFRRLAIPYHQPRLATGHPTEDEAKAGPPLALLFKEFGQVYRDPVLPREDLLVALREILRCVYQIEEPSRSATWVILCEALDRIPNDQTFIVPTDASETSAAGS